MSKPRILTLDIETSPLESYTWGLWQQNVGLNQIKTEWTILSYSAKWLGEKRVIYRDTGGRGPDRVRDDSELLAEIWELLDKADIVVAQNGQRFDVKKINARLLQAKYLPYSPIKIVDTLLVAKKHFAFTSNKLEWMTSKLTATQKLKHKKFPGFELWVQCLADNPQAWKEMKAYNKVDVISTEELYLEMRPWIEGHPNVANYSDEEETACPKCGGTDLHKRGVARTQVGQYHRYQCNTCGGWSRSRYTINTLAHRKSLLSN